MGKDSQEFILKLFQIVNRKESPVVEWDQQGKGFLVHNLLQFTNQVLFPKFNISRLESFARKLNKYGFKRSKVGKNKIRFFHPHFSQDGSLLCKIQKLNKEETLPKHIKLRLLRDQLSRDTITDHDIGSYLKICHDSTEEPVQKYEVINGNYFLVQLKKESSQSPSNQERKTKEVQINVYNLATDEKKHYTYESCSNEV